MELHRRTLQRPVRAEHAAIPHLRTQYGFAALAFIEELTGGSWHDLPLCVTALRTRQQRFENYIRHSFTTHGLNLYPVLPAHVYFVLQIVVPGLVV